MPERVLLLDIDSAVPNLALMKLANWHRAHGDLVGLDTSRPTLVYASSVFTWGKRKLFAWRDQYPDLIAGGTGVDLVMRLPSEIEAQSPWYGLYHARWPDWRGVGLGFLQRGCPRRCGFCVVPRKEGRPAVVATIDDLINPDWEIYGWHRPFIALLDNNLLSLGSWTIDTLADLAERRIDVCFSQGLDIRLVTTENAAALARVHYWNLRHSKRQLTFAFDHVGIEKAFRRGVTELSKAGIRPYRLQSFVLVGYDSTLDEDLHRIAIIRSLGIDPFVMLYRDPMTGQATADPLRRHLARWVNRRLYRSCTWEEYTPAHPWRYQMKLPLEGVRQSS